MIRNATMAPLALLAIACVMDAPDVTDPAFIEGEADESLDGVVPDAPAGSTDYSYYNAVDVCLPTGNWGTYAPYVYSRDNGVFNRHPDEFLQLNCVLPAVYYNNVGYSSNEIGSIVIYGHNRRSGYTFGINLYSANTTDLSPSGSYGSRSISYGASMSTGTYSSPGIPSGHPYVIISASVPPAYWTGSEWHFSGLYNIRVYQAE